MGFSVLLHLVFLLQMLPSLVPQATQDSKLFRAYIGAELLDVKFSDVPINPSVNFHFILSFAIDYTTAGPPTPTNGKFNIFWDSKNLSPLQVASIKGKHRNVNVAVSLGGDSVGGSPASFSPSSVDSWVSNAVTSLTQIIEQYGLDGIDVDYEHFHAGPDVFAECIGRLLTVLKQNGVIKFASIAPFDDPKVQSHYLALWRQYAGLVDYVNFQFYAYDDRTTVPQFLRYFETQSEKYRGGKVLVSYISDGSGGLSPVHGFFSACKSLKLQGKLNGIFVWSADDSKASGFKYETQSQDLLASAY